MEINIFQIVINYCIPLILGTILGFITTKLKKNKSKEEAIEKGLVALLRNELVRRYREYETAGEISILDKENFEDMFAQYENLGGNGTMKKMAKDVLNLSTKIIK